MVLKERRPSSRSRGTQASATPRRVGRRGARSASAPRNPESLAQWRLAALRVRPRTWRGERGLQRAREASLCSLGLIAAHHLNAAQRRERQEHMLATQGTAVFARPVQQRQAAARPGQRQPAALARSHGRAACIRVNAAAQAPASPMITVDVPLGDRSYPIYIGRGLLDKGELLRKHVPGSTALVVTNETIAPLYLKRWAPPRASSPLFSIPLCRIRSARLRPRTPGLASPPCRMPPSRLTRTSLFPRTALAHPPPAPSPRSPRAARSASRPSSSPTARSSRRSRSSTRRGAGLLTRRSCEDH